MTKKHILVLFLVMALCLAGCNGDPGEESTPASADIPEGMVVLEENGYTVTVDGETVTLTESGLTLELTAGSNAVLRDGHIVAMMDEKLQIIAGQACVSQAFYGEYFCAQGGESSSLFHGALFFPEEALAALTEPEASEFNRKLLEQILLPTSMGIEEPHVDLERILITTPLSGYSEAIQQEMARLGYPDAEHITYGEYAVVSGAQTLAQAGISTDIQTTVAQYNREMREEAVRQFEAGLSEEEKAFAQQHGIELQDLNYLKQEFADAMLTLDTDALTAALREYYAVDVAYLGELAH